MFARPTPREPLSQGDIIEDCPLVGLNLTVIPVDLSDPATKWWTARVIVLTQACDLAQAKVDSVLVARVHDAQTLVEAGVLKGTVIRDHMRRHLQAGMRRPPATSDSTVCRTYFAHKHRSSSGQDLEERRPGTMPMEGLREMNLCSAGT